MAKTKKQLHSSRNDREVSKKTITAKDIDLVVAGRTDSGVHAEGQVAHFDIKKSFCTRKLQLGINFHLLNEKFGKDISIKKVTRVNEKFNARFSRTKKTLSIFNF